jgi:hypothetical protein
MQRILAASRHCLVYLLSNVHIYTRHQHISSNNVLHACTATILACAWIKCMYIHASTRNNSRIFGIVLCPRYVLYVPCRIAAHKRILYADNSAREPRKICPLPAVCIAAARGKCIQVPCTFTWMVRYCSTMRMIHFSKCVQSTQPFARVAIT